MQYPHRRKNWLTGEWILVSPHRLERPWNGETAKIPEPKKIDYDPACYLCPGNTRANGEINPDYNDVYVFNNDFPALIEDIPDILENPGGFFGMRTVKGCCRVICYSKNHSGHFKDFDLKIIQKIIQEWAKQTEELGQHYTWVQIFENRGQMMGASNPHPHGQIWALDTLPTIPFREMQEQKKYYETHHSYLLADYLTQEMEVDERVIFQNDDWVVLVPFWAIWPYETLILPKRNLKYLFELNHRESQNLAIALKKLISIYDRIFNISFPYTMGWHQAPSGTGGDVTGWWLHGHFYPPLLRSATIRKYMVGFEMLAESQRDITAEWAARLLKKIGEEISVV